MARPIPDTVKREKPGVWRKMPHFSVMYQSGELRLYAMKFRAVDAHEHADNLLDHVQGPNPVKRERNRARGTRSLQIFHSLLREMYVIPSVPSTGL